MSRPEHISPPEIYYNDDMAKKYTENTRITTIQAEMSLRAVELLCLPEDQTAFLLDIGCGSGLSGEILEEEGHVWVGMDISKSMLDIAVDKDLEGDLFLQDIGQGMGFRPGTFDGAISISVIQWLCNADKTINNPRKRLKRFFTTLFIALRRGARAVFQFYPENDDQINMIMESATVCGFTGGVVIDYPNSKKAKKYYLCLFAGSSGGHNGKANGAASHQQLPQGLTGEHENTVENSNSNSRFNGFSKGKKGKRVSVKSKDWILHKKDIQRKKGEKPVPRDSKYTGRKRRTAF